LIKSIDPPLVAVNVLIAEAPNGTTVPVAIVMDRVIPVARDLLIVTVEKLAPAASKKLLRNNPPSNAKFVDAGNIDPFATNKSASIRTVGFTAMLNVDPASFLYPPPSMSIADKLVVIVAKLTKSPLVVIDHVPVPAWITP
jgi:hypothetical protein